MLEFKVEKQKLTRIDVFEPATDSEEYLKARFTINNTDWNGKTKTALFRLGESVYKVILNSNNECVVPSEVLVHHESKYARTQGSKFFVSLVGEYSTTRITTNELQIDLNSSGYSDALTPEKPTENEYQQILTQYANNEAAINEVKAESEAARADLVGVKNIFANAIKGNLSGAVVKADDVSPVEHNPVVKVHGKNLIPFPYKNVDKNIDGVSFSVQNNGGIALSGTPTSNFVAFELYTGKPLANKGKVIIELLGEFEGVYFRYDIKDSKGNVLESGGAQTTKTINLDVFPNAAEWNLFIRNVDKIGTFSGVVYPQIRFENTDVGYTPYLNPSTMVAKRCGKNLLKPTDRSGAGYTATVNENGSVTVTGSANTTNGIYLTLASPSVDRPLLLHKGEKYFIQSWSDNGKAILMKCVKLDGGDAWTSPSQFNQTGGAEYKSIVQIYVESTKHEVGDTSLCGTYRFQLEVGEEGTDFEPYKEISEHTPASDGTVEGITSLSPNMTIFADTEGEIVECEYIKDTNKVIQKIADALNITI